MINPCTGSQEDGKTCVPFVAPIAYSTVAVLPVLLAPGTSDPTPRSELYKVHEREKRERRVNTELLKLKTGKTKKMDRTLIDEKKKRNTPMLSEISMPQSSLFWTLFPRLNRRVMEGYCFAMAAIKSRI